jgi:hypothetical protein
VKRVPVKIGEVRGKLTVIREAYSATKRKVLCECSCGAKRKVRLDHFLSGHTTSCGRCGIEMGGVRKSLVDWARDYGIPESTLRYRLKTMSLREALSAKTVR